MKKIILASFFFLGLTLVFALVTFPYGRLNSQLSQFLETVLSQSLGERLDCQLEELAYAFPIGLGARDLSCLNGIGETRFHLKEVSILALPFYQRLKSLIEDPASSSEGEIQIQTHAGWSLPSSARITLQDLPLNAIIPFVLMVIPPQHRFFVQDLELRGRANGLIDIPFGPWANADATVDLTLEELAIPPQSLLATLNLRGIDFETARVKISMRRGGLTFEDVRLISPDISVKLEGNFQVSESPDQSQGQVFLKWQIGDRSSLRNSSAAALLVNAPCPSRDSEGFCTQEINNLRDFEAFTRF